MRIIGAVLLSLWLAAAALAQTYPNSGGSSSLVIGTTPITGGADMQVLFNSGGKISSDAGLTKVAGATGQVTSGGNLLLSGASYIISDVSFSSALNMNAAAVQFARAATPTTIIAAAGDYGNGNEGMFVRVTGGLFWASTAQASGAKDTSLCRPATGVVEVGSGTSCASSGTMMAALFAPGVIYSAAGTALPACGAGTNGYTAIVSDTTGPTYRSAYTSGGAVTGRVLCINGTGWIND